jgi:hypothetical protein
MRALISSAALLASLLGYGSSSTDSGGINGGNTDCAVTPAGAISADLACTAFASSGQEIVGQSVLSIAVSGSPGFSLGISVTGQLGVGTITESSPSVQIAVATASNDGNLWSQDVRDPVHGTVTVHLTTASLQSDGHTLTAHGTFDATLSPSPSDPNATGTVTAHGTF